MTGRGLQIVSPGVGGKAEPPMRGGEIRIDAQGRAQCFLYQSDALLQFEQAKDNVIFIDK